MNRKNRSNEEWPAELQKAVREYPRIVASPDFNQRILQALAAKQAQQSKIDLFCDALDRIFERPILKLLSTALFAILLAWGGANLVSTFAFPNLSKPMPSHLTNNSSQSIGDLTLHAGNLYAWQSNTMLQINSLEIAPFPQKVPTTAFNQSEKKETSCSPNETILWG